MQNFRRTKNKKDVNGLAGVHRTRVPNFSVIQKMAWTSRRERGKSVKILELPRIYFVSV